MEKYTDTVTVIIPCRNEEKFIGACLDSFVNQTYPKELLNIIVADGMSTDNTRNIINEYCNKYKFINMIDNEEFIVPKGMNKAMKLNNSDINIIFGAHAEADKDFVLENVKALINADVACVGGTIETINSTNKGSAIALAMSCPFGVGNALFRYATKESYVDTVGFGGYRKSILDKIGYFDEELVRNQDDELNYRVIKEGYKILLTPKIKSKYYARGEYKKLWKQYFQYGYWKVRVIQKHNKPAALRHIIPLLFVIFLILGGIFSLFSKTIFYSYGFILALYLLLAVYFSFKLSMKSKFRYLFNILPCFPILHLSYGLGFLLGVINFYLLKSNSITNKNTDISR